MSLLDTVEYLGSLSFPPSQTYSRCSTTEVVGKTTRRLILKLINRKLIYNNKKIWLSFRPFFKQKYQIAAGSVCSDVKICCFFGLYCCTLNTCWLDRSSHLS